VPAADAALRAELERFSNGELVVRLTELDPVAAEIVDLKNRRRMIRAIEIALVSGTPISEQRTQWQQKKTVAARRGIGFQPMDLIGTGEGASGSGPCHGEEDSSAGSRCHDQEQSGVFVFRDREDLYQRINQRVEGMLSDGVIDEVRRAGEISRTAEQMIGVRDIRRHLAGDISLAECTSRIQQTTRRYAKRQLTWFRNQSNFEPLNLSLLKRNEAVERICAAAVAVRGSE
jgi:tRNA dimethylallyltransferase